MYQRFIIFERVNLSLNCQIIVIYSNSEISVNLFL